MSKQQNKHFHKYSNTTDVKYNKLIIKKETKSTNHIYE